MKSFIASIAFLFVYSISFGQTIEGNRLLDLVGKPITDPLFQDLKKQETFYTDAWDEDFTIYISRDNGVISEVELENGKLRYGSKTERYGYYKRTLPMQLSWSMSPSDFSNKLGSPVLTSTAMNFSDYKKGDWSIRIFYEENKPVSICYKKTTGVAGSTYTSPPPAQPTKAQPISATVAPGSDWLLKIQGEQASFNYEVFKTLINYYPTLYKYAGNDSVDYIGQVYYSSKIKMPGFDRVAIKRKKQSGKWFFEAFLKMGNDSKAVANTFFAIYDAIKGSVKSGIGDDFILASVARDDIRKNPMNWLVQWSLYSNYKGFTPGLGKLRMIILLSGMEKFMKPGEMEYTLKFYICDDDTKADFFTWDTPK